MFKVLVKLFIGIIVFMDLSFSQNLKEIRPPATPLIAVDPYFSVWSTSDKLYNERTKHWTGTNNGMLCLVKIDGKNSINQLEETVDLRPVLCLQTLARHQSLVEYAALEQALLRVVAKMQFVIQRFVVLIETFDNS